jgi:hypothetical protein
VSLIARKKELNRVVHSLFSFQGTLVIVAVVPLFARASRLRRQDPSYQTYVILSTTFFNSAELEETLCCSDRY